MHSEHITIDDSPYDCPPERPHCEPNCPPSPRPMGKSMSIELIHYSRKPLEAIKAVHQKEEPFGKPKGLWVSVGDAWLRYLTESPSELVRSQLAKCTYANHITLKDDADILLVTNTDQFDVFNHEYGSPWPCVKNRQPIQGQVIDWKQVSTHHQGIIIAPHLREKAEDEQGSWKPETIWYWTWVCASGCLWDSDAVRNIRTEPAFPT